MESIRELMEAYNEDKLLYNEDKLSYNEDKIHIVYISDCSNSSDCDITKYVRTATRRRKYHIHRNK